MALKSEDIFIEIKDPNEKVKILEDLVRHQPDLKIKGLAPMATVFSVTPESLDGNSLRCKVAQKAFLNTKETDLILQFNLHEHKYISQAKFVLSGTTLTVNISSSLYRVQRREDFRLRLPRSFQGNLLMEIAGKPLKATLIDISAGGCRVEVIPPANLNIADSIKATLRISQRDDLPVHVEIRYIGEDSDKSPLRTLGLQFVNQNEIFKNRMAALVMDLYREFFTKRN